VGCFLLLAEIGELAGGGVRLPFFCFFLCVWGVFFLLGQPKKSTNHNQKKNHKKINTGTHLPPKVFLDSEGLLFLFLILL